MIGPRRTVIRVGLGALVAVVGLALARPWTIRPIGSSSAEAFDAEVYVESIWTRVLRAADSTAVDLAIVAQMLSPPRGESEITPARRALFIKATGVVSDVNLRSRVGVAHVQIAGLHAPGVAIQIGPVLRGTALRDALDFVRFTDFTNQFDFAAVSGALNSRVLRTVLGPIDVETLSGQAVSFVGAAVVGDGRAESTLEVVPVIIQVGQGPQ